MCRLALMNKAMVEYLGKEALAYHFERLELELGGDGQGVGALFPDGRVRTHKGVDQDSGDSAAWIVSMCGLGATHFIFHTRLATTGSRRNRNCHPFRHGSLVGAHNGTCSRYTGAGGKDLTDSEGVLYTIQRAGLGLSYLEDVSGVFIGFREGRPFVIKGQYHTDLELAKYNKTNAYMYTSKTYKEEENWFDKIHSLGAYSWFGNAETEAVPYTKKVYYAPSSSYYESWDTEGGEWVTSGTSTGHKGSRYGRRVDGTWGYLTQYDLEELEDEEEYGKTAGSGKQDRLSMSLQDSYDNYDVNKAVIEAMQEDDAEDGIDYEDREIEPETGMRYVKGNYFFADGNKWVWNGNEFIMERSLDELEDIKKKYALISI